MKTQLSAGVDPHTELVAPAVLLDILITLRRQVIEEGDRRYEQWRLLIREEREEFSASARNLAYYLALRRHDLRDLQRALSPWGLSSLGRMEANVLPTLDAVIATLSQLAHHDPPLPRPSQAEFRRGREALESETTRVLGVPPADRRVRLMVTLPSQAADSPELVEAMVAHGMNIARINCAHDSPVEWARMIENVRRAERATNRTCRIAMDLGGPKSRTGEVIQPKKHRIQRGDVILLTPPDPAPVPKDGKKSPLDAYPIRVSCTLSAAFDHLKVGSRVWFDDGRIGALVHELNDYGAVLLVTHAAAKGAKLKPDKGVNFPGTELHLNPLTEKDLIDLDFVVAHADIVHYSFVQDAHDIRRLQTEIDRRNPERRRIALVAKIETARAVKNLPELIIEAGGVQPFGVMIARGDLAVEIGYERLAEMQEEILWLCEAAHVPVIWATQVLESLAKDGIPSRAEITDAAMAERAECVMLNKGAYILDAMQILDSVLRRMEAHQNKKTAQLRALKSWES